MLKPGPKGVQLEPTEEVALELIAAIQAVMEGRETQIEIDGSITKDPVVVSISDYKGTVRLDIRHWYQSTGG